MSAILRAVVARIMARAVCFVIIFMKMISDGILGSN